jgi:hypothetical protein
MVQVFTLMYHTHSWASNSLMRGCLTLIILLETILSVYSLIGRFEIRIIFFSYLHKKLSNFLSKILVTMLVIPKMVYKVALLSEKYHLYSFTVPWYTLSSSESILQLPFIGVHCLFEQSPSSEVVSTMGIANPDVQHLESIVKNDTERHDWVCIVRSRLKCFSTIQILKSPWLQERWKLGQFQELSYHRPAR